MADEANPTPAWLGEHPLLREAQARLGRVAPSRLPVLVLGESGTGKELAARWLHARAGDALGPATAARPFVALDCGALPDGLLESELFGTARGAFTGATSARAGLVEEACGGTLFLDEIGDASPLLQMRLLRLIAEGEFRRLGEVRLRHARVRVVAATHRDLSARVAEGRFRADLWYRLAAVEVELPPLRERGSDVLLLARVFLGRARGGAWWDGEACGLIAHYPWPGNVRELALTCEAAALFADPDGRVGAAALPARLRAGAAHGRAVAGRLRAQVEQLERARIHEALVAAGGNRARAARRLGLSRSGLWKKLKRGSGPLAGPAGEREEAWPRKS
jgi:transcriptional regulator with PAS, ATPase and Fis domain